MANRLKKKTPPPPDPEQLAPDKEAGVTVTEVVKDERTAKIAGAVSLLLAVFLFLALSSYLFTWQEDQDKVQQFGIRIFSTEEVKITNLLGVLGAFTAHQLIYQGFGLASFLFCTTLFVLGVNLLFGKKVFSLIRNLRYVLVGLLLFSTGLAFFTRGSSFSWGGALGEMLSAWSVQWIGQIGTGAILGLAAFSYFIWRFNPVFKWPERKQRLAPAENNMVPIFTEDDEKPVFQEWQEQEEAMRPGEEIPSTDPADEEPVSHNRMKPGGKGVMVILPQHQSVQEPLHAFDSHEATEEESEASTRTSETDEEEQAEDPAALLVPPVATARKTAETAHVELEIKETPEKEEETAADVPRQGSLASKYDATLDLKGYRYPTLDLLETHGSEKIVHDPEELETNKNQIIATLRNYDIAIQRIAATVGPTVTLYEIVPAPGVRISRIKNLEDDIALSLAALGIRIIAPIPGKG
ncbi:MAG TPA: DNA translocase FtsK 4TM domain-containing protein, partial [Sediminibacterium sp.]|nr:DNA translocase FtsK 4TM domain-containing protein [Sediminibacterium sp.]